MLAVIARIVLSSALSAGIHFYVWLRLVRRLELPRPWHRAISIAMVLLFVSVPVAISTRTSMPELSSALAWVAMPWMALVGLSFVAAFALDVARLAVWVGRKVARRIRPPSAAGTTKTTTGTTTTGKTTTTAEGLSRRLFLARVSGGAAATVAGGSVAHGMVTARGTHEVVDVEIRLAKLPAALDGFTIVQLSDLHVGLTIDRAFVQRVVDHTNRLTPDLIALTGDLVDGKVEDLRDDIAPLGDLRAKHGVFSVTGNHEYYAGADPWIAELTRLGARCLRNERVTIARGDASFELAGVDDHSASGWRGHGEDLAAATAGRDPSKALVLLAHQPRQVRRAAGYGVDLQLSGHTHGGQIWPWHYIVKIQQGGLLAGRYEHGGTQLYVSRGCGYWGPPVRVLAPLEITRIILRAGG